MNTPLSTKLPTQILATDIAAKLQNLDDFIQAMRKGIAANKPWARQLHARLREADTGIQVLRLATILNRPFAEIADAAHRVRAATTAMNTAAAGGRADATTQTVLLLIERIAQDIERYYRAQIPG